MNFPPPPPPWADAGLPVVHVPPPVEDREDRVRRKMIMWDRIKVLVILGVLLVIFITSKRAQLPIMTWTDAWRDQIRAKWWMPVVAGIELLRQIHYVISERSPGWHGFWQRKMFGGWERRLSRWNPWNRFRLQRAGKRAIFAAIVGVYFASRWNVSFFEALATSPRHFYETFFAPARSNLPLFWSLLVSSVFGIFSLAILYSVFFFDSSIETYKPGEIRSRFADVWGQDPVLRRVQETVDFLEKPMEIEKRGGYVPGGILLWGPPGTGKTLMAEAMAGETGRPFVFVDPSAFIQTFVGVAPMKVRFLYSKLRKLAMRHGGVVVFFDEADSLGSRSGASQGGQIGQGWTAMHSCGGMHYVSAATANEVWQRQLGPALADAGAARAGGLRGIIMGGMGMGGGGGALQALLTQMSGLRKPRGFIGRRLRSFLNIKAKRPPKYRILHVFATNQPNALDPALLRPGRIDRKFHVGYPHADGRKRTFEGYLDKITHQLTPAQIERLSVITPYYTGARIKDIVNESVIVAMRESRDVVTWMDVLTAKYHKGHGEAEDMQFTALERHQVAIHEASHAVSMYRLQKRSIIDVATIEPRSEFLGMVSPIPLEERFTEWRSEREIDAMTFLASLAGERMFFEGDSSTGVIGDLTSATSIVLDSMAFRGMGTTVAARQVTVAGLRGNATAIPEDGADRSIHDTAFGHDVEQRLQELLAEVTDLLVENRRFVFAVAHALETHKTITGEDVVGIFQGTRGTTVDGAAYHTDEFMLSYEAYHLAMVDAHRRQERTNAAVPSMSPAYATNGHRNATSWEPPPRPYAGQPSPPPPPPPR